MAATIPLKLVEWRLPCPTPDRPISRFQRDCVTGVAGNRKTPKPWKDPRPRPRLVYLVGDNRRVAIGRRGESVSTLAADIAKTYPTARIVGMGESGRRAAKVAAFAAGWCTAQEAAAKLSMRKATFLDMTRDAETIEMGIALDDDLIRRMWRMDQELIPEAKPGRTAIWKTERTGEFTTRGKPKLRKIGAECWYGGVQLHRSPPTRGAGGFVTIQRWTEKDLLGLPYPGDWGTQQRVHAALAEVGVH